MTTSEEGPVAKGVGSVELNGINLIDESERKGTPKSLFWPWFSANVSVFGISYGSFVLGFGLSFGQALIASVIGVVFSFFLCGLVALAGKRGSVPTMIASRATFGVRGNALPSLLSWILTVGWETVLTALATLATATVFDELGWGSGDGIKIAALIVVTVLIVGAGVLGFDTIMRLSAYITVIGAVLTVVYMVLVADEISWSTVNAMPAGSAESFIGGLIFMMTGFGLGWVNVAADYSRYLPRSSSSPGVVAWTTIGAALAPVVLVIFGLLLAGSSPQLSGAIGFDPIGALASLLPTWFLVPFVVVAVLGLVGGAALDIYSSGLALLSLGLPAPRWAAAGIDGVIMLIGTVLIVFVADDFFVPFQGFLITLGVPIAAWCGVMISDIAMRRRDYAEAELFDPAGRYRAVNWVSVGLVVIATVIGWGLVTNTYAGWLDWQGYLLEPFGFGGKDGHWASANLGVLFALVIGYVGSLLLNRSAVRREESA